MKDHVGVLNEIENFDNDLVSIIVPVYNSEIFLEKSIDSILNQTYKNLEIIIIDDGSKDRSVDICKKYALEDSRIVFLQNEKNCGVSKTRNRGLDIARGKYIGFVDSDDYIEKDMYEIFVKNIKMYDADLVQCSTFSFHDIDLDGNEKKVLFNNEEVIAKSLDWNYFSCMIWDKLFTKKIIDDIRFKENWINCEDSMFTAQVMNNVNKACILSKNLYHYRENIAGSLSKTFDLALIKNSYEIYDFREKCVLLKYPVLLSNYYLYKLNDLNNYLFSKILESNFNSNEDLFFVKYFLLDILTLLKKINYLLGNKIKEFFSDFVFELQIKIHKYVEKNIRIYRENSNIDLVNFFERYLFELDKICLETPGDRSKVFGKEVEEIIIK